MLRHVDRLFHIRPQVFWYMVVRMSEATPLLLISDSPAGSTGLGRITRELATRIHADLPQFRVGTLGIGGSISRQLPFQQYPVMRIADNMAIHDLPEVMKDFCGNHPRPAVMTILNASWTPWIANPAFQLPQSPLRDCLHSGPGNSRPFDLWGYIPVDGHTPSRKLPQESITALRGFDRLLGYTGYGAQVIDHSLASPNSSLSLFKQPTPTPHLPHGTDTSVFFPRDRAKARKNFLTHIQDKPLPVERAALIRDDMVLISAIATNTPRKDWNLAFAVCSELLKRGVNIFFWGHTDALVKHWSIAALAAEYGMEKRTVVSCTSISDDNLAWALSACDALLGIGSGGGWEMPHTEALACQIPVITGIYAGGADYMPSEMLVDPIGYQIEGQSMIQRPVFRASDWADAIQANLGKPAALPAGLSWDECWPEWSAWLLEGVQ